MVRFAVGGAILRWRCWPAAAELAAGSVPGDAIAILGGYGEFLGRDWESPWGMATWWDAMVFLLSSVFKLR